MDKLLGVGLPKALALAIFTMLVIVVAKVIVNKYPVKGLSEVVNTI